MLTILFAAAAAQASIPSFPAKQLDPDMADIVVTAALVPVPLEDAPASVTVFDQSQLDALGATFVSDIVRLSPGVSVAVSGAQGAQTQVRIRGAEANHTLLFVDGIAFNDLAANNVARFETFTAQGLGRIELIRGPQSALWGSEALGGVIALDTPDPLGRTRASASLEYGSDDFASVAAALASGGERGGVSATASWARSDGIDILGGGRGDKDGFATVSGSLKGVLRPGGDYELGAVGHYIHHDNQYDGSDIFFHRADTLDASTAETYALRGWARFGLTDDAPWSASVEAQYLDSENRNQRAAVPVNSSYGRRLRLDAQAVRRFASESSRHELIARVEREQEDFGTRDLRPGGGAGDRDLDRARTALVGEWRASWGDRLTTDIALRHDHFNRFKDATTLRANAVFNLTRSFALLGGYGDGIAQPSFVDLFGFGLNSGFIPNPNLTPERSHGFEAGIRWRSATTSIEAVAFSNALRDEIVEDFSLYPNYTVVNAAAKSRRRGIEVSGEWRPSSGLRLGANYTYLDARERQDPAASALREVRRPRNSANLFLDWQSGRITLGGSLAYVGARRDDDFDPFPAVRVKLNPYLLTGARAAYRLSERLEAFVRIENVGDADYQDVVGYNAPGRKAYAGIRLRYGA